MNQTCVRVRYRLPRNYVDVYLPESCRSSGALVTLLLAILGLRASDLCDRLLVALLYYLVHTSLVVYIPATYVVRSTMESISVGGSPPCSIMCCYAPPRFSSSVCSPADRVSILKALSASVSLGPDVDLEAVGNSSKVSVERCHIRSVS